MEIGTKGGADQAGSLERLDAVEKCLAETPTNCDNFFIAGVITKKMDKRLKLSGVKTYRLHEVSVDGEHWNKSVEEVFYSSLRVYNI